MEQILNINGIDYKINSTENLSIEQMNEVRKQVSGQTCSSCEGKPLKLASGPGTPIIVGDTRALTATITTAGTPPYTYNWYIKKPDNTDDDKLGRTTNIENYTFAYAGIYKIYLYVTDSCTGGAKSCRDPATGTYDVTVSAACAVPVCNFTIS